VHWSLRDLQHGAVRARLSTLATFALLVGALSAPLCPCVCLADAVAEPAESSCHHHDAGDTDDPPAPNHDCEHPACAVLSATLPAAQYSPALDSNNAPGSLSFAIAPSRVAAASDLSFRTAPGPERDLGPPIPAPRFSILRL
jgi:hypothetical protein